MPPEIKITPGMIAAGVEALWATNIYNTDKMSQAEPEEAVTEIFQAMALVSSVALSKATD